MTVYFDSKAELESVFNPIHLPDTTSRTPRTKNVVVIIIESFGREYIGTYNRHVPGYKGYTPFTDSLLANGALTYRYSYCNGRKSIDGMPSILSSIPMFVEPFFLSPYSINHVSGLADCLNQKGYETAFFHGAERGSMGFMAFARATKFKEYYGREDFVADHRTRGDKDYDGWWGISDEPFMQYMCMKQTEMKQPFMTALFTLSSHHPFRVPEPYKDVFKEKNPDMPIYKVIRYTDMALQHFFASARKQPWFQNTIFVITSDHTNMTAIDEYKTDLGGFCSPVIFFGIIGMSGAGKSTLVRSINFLERPSEGSVRIDGVDLAELSEKELRQKRSGIGMIFQNFNLLEQKNVLDNICFPLEITGVKKKEAKVRAQELLKLVKLQEKEKAYPSQLSGGQKQRVAIARALATNPQILLCDEATSALDPQTTASILALLREINEELGITIVIITHSMAVVTEVCKRVAIIDGGRLVEEGPVREIFENPKSDAAKELISGKEIRYTPTENLNTGRRIRIVFLENSAYEPVIANVILKFAVPVNILRADTRNVSGKALGEMILGLPEGEELQNDIIEYLKETGLAVSEVNENE